MKRSSVSTGGAGRLSMQDLRSQDLNKQGLHTPQTTSGHGSRNSQFGIFSTSEKIKDPRPLNDKAFIQQCIRQLCELFLDYTIKCYESFMSGADSFEEMNAELQSKLKDLFNVDASKLESLAAKNKELNEQIARLEQEREKEPNRLESLRKLKASLQADVQKYQAYMSNLESHSAILDQKLNSLNEEIGRVEDLFNVDASKLESLAAKNKELNEQIARLEQEREKEPNRLESLRKLKASLQADVQKYQAYMSNLESHSAILDQKLNSLNEEIGRVELECETIKQENTRLQNIVDNQKYSVADTERINHERNELQQTINKLTKELESEQQQLWNEELKYARGKEAIETQLAEYHKLARKLKLIPKGAENSKGYDFEIKFNPESGANCLVKYRAQVYIETQLAEYHKLARKLKLIPKGAENSKGYDFEIKFNPESGANCLVKYRAQVYVPLKELLNETEEEINKALNKKMGLEDTLEQLNTMITESRRSVRTLKEEVQKLDDLYQQKVKEAEEEDEKCANELESLEKHKHLLESAVNEGLSEAMNELDAVQREYQLVVQTTTEERRKVGNNLQRLLEMVATHVGSVEKHLEEQIIKVDRECEDCMSEDLLENIGEIADKYKKKAALLKASDE
ncbi:Kinetochore protein NDC80 like protein [Tupaia chinensis]|uniref:Kinetochore protein NDC80 like protein n=1 Tax=Tupaia chinensis TaxID=246437 RepID=L9L2U0_TUPCH|nr:Kinetochore protein NDC80 like protein [Tupaia chinensis]